MKRMNHIKHADVHAYTGMLFTSYLGQNLVFRDGTLHLDDKPVLDSDDGICKMWTITPAREGKYFITSCEGLHLQDCDGKAGLSLAEGTNQMWSITDAGHGKWFITSNRGGHLEDLGGVNLSISVDNKGDFQMWSIENFIGDPLCTGV